jgi:hypothetical protein
MPQRVRLKESNKVITCLDDITLQELEELLCYTLLSPTDRDFVYGILQQRRPLSPTQEKRFADIKHRVGRGSKI